MVKGLTEEPKIDLHKFYCEEVSMPCYREQTSKNFKSTSVNYKRSYLPNGKPVELLAIEDQDSMINKLYIENWKRKPYIYQTAFEGEQYHLVRNRDDHLL